MSEQKLPEELLREILAYCFAMPRDVFCTFTTRYEPPPAAQDKQSLTHSKGCHNLLLVSKRWLRVGSPLLYESISIRTSTHAQTVAKLFKHDPRLGGVVRKVQLLGGYGRDLPAIIKSILNVHTVYLNMSVASNDSIFGIKKAFPILNPTRLYLGGRPARRQSKQSLELRQVLNANMGKWTSLRYVHYGPYCDITPMMLGLKEAPALEELWVGNPSMSFAIRQADLELREVLAKPSIRQVHCSYYGSPADNSKVLARMLEDHRYPDEIRKLITYHDCA